MKMPWEIDATPLRLAPKVNIIGMKPRRWARIKALMRHNGEPCPYCGKPMMWKNDHNESTAPSRDHRVPSCRGGYNSEENILICCRKCNTDKGPLDEEEFFAWKHRLASRLDISNRTITGRWVKGQYRGELLMAYPKTHRRAIRLRFCEITKEGHAKYMARR